MWWLPMVARYEREIRLPLSASESALEDAIQARDRVRNQLAGARPPRITILGGVP